ncbi:hypothetical protein FOA52_001778 [Chlamydomonas sp. UWO 241]|nr:hypothetical protein FOA52_001778 [Chlamydomonas sp. UWO 241]
MNADAETSEVRGVWDAFVANNNLVIIILCLVIFRFVIFLPQWYFFIGILLVALVVIVQVPTVDPSPNLDGGNKRIDVSNSVTRLLTVLCQYTTFVARSVYSLLGLFTLFFLVEKIKTINSNVERSQYGSNIMWSIAWCINKAVAYLGFQIWPVFEVAPSGEYHVTAIVRQFVASLHRSGLAVVIGCVGLVCAMVFGMVMVSIPTPSVADGTKDTLYRLRVTRTLKLFSLVLYLIIPLMVMIYMRYTFKEIMYP